MAHFSDLYVEFGGVDRLRSLFDQVLSYFLKDVTVSKDVIRVLPPKLGDGVEADLFNLFWAVRKIGDFELVSKNHLWEFVAKECGLDITHVGSLKLIYIKYLKDLDQWLNHEGFKDKKFENGEFGVLQKLDSLICELGGCKFSLNSVGFEADKKGKCVDVDLEIAKTQMGFPRIDEKDENFSGLDDKRFKFSCENVISEVGSLGKCVELKIVKTQMGFSKIDEKDANFSGLNDKRFKFLHENVIREVGSSRKCVDLEIAKIQMGFSRIDEKDEKFSGLDDKRNDLSQKIVIREVGSSGKCVELETAKTQMGFSRIHEKDENFGGLDEKRNDFSCENFISEVGSSGIKDNESFSVENEKRIVLSPTNVLSFHSDNSGHNDTSDNDNDNLIVAKTIIKNIVGSQKRKREESLLFYKMLDWVAHASRNPHDIAIGSIPSSSKWKKYKSNEVWKQVLLTKETLFAKRNVDSGNKLYGSQKKRHMMHPSMYEDDKVPVHFSSKRLCSQRVTSVKSCSCPGCSSCSSSRNKRQKPEPKKSPQNPETIELQNDPCEKPEKININVSAEVPEWTGVVSESDPKWLGTRMWPPPEGNIGKPQKGIGKGRKSSCKCSFPGSADCVRLHISNNRKRVKRALGPLFYKWKFNRMGEEASSVSWSLEEETEFKNLVIKARQDLTHKSKSRHEIMSKFWRRASEAIPFKTKELLVSYYFNVFVLRRRSYQNRIMPENIDSDDDEHEVGFENNDDLSVKCAKIITNLES